jgi:hypothetical protein
LTLNRHRMPLSHPWQTRKFSIHPCRTSGYYQSTTFCLTHTE